MPLHGGYPHLKSFKVAQCEQKLKADMLKSSCSTTDIPATIRSKNSDTQERNLTMKPHKIRRTGMALVLGGLAFASMPLPACTIFVLTDNSRVVSLVRAELKTPLH